MAKQDSPDLEIGFWPTEDLSPRSLEMKAISARTKSVRDVYVLLIHGFNVRGWSAESNFDEFRRNAKDRVSDSFSENMLSITWPGKLWYWAALVVAKQSAALLADFLEALSRKHLVRRDCHVVLIGHSLGCRVILEALALIGARRDRPRRIDTFFMAPAIPIHLLEDGQRLRAAATQTTKRGVFYSGMDLALRVGFPRVQTIAAGEDPIEGTYPEAVGLRGNPRDLWTSCDGVRHGHGGYWTNKRIPQWIGQSLGYAVERYLPSRALQERSLESRQL